MWGQGPELTYGASLLSRLGSAPRRGANPFAGHFHNTCPLPTSEFEAAFWLRMQEVVNLAASCRFGSLFDASDFLSRRKEFLGANDVSFHDPHHYY